MRRISQGTEFHFANAFGWTSCWQGDQVAPDDKLNNLTVANGACDDSYDPDQVAFLLTHQNTTQYMGGVRWIGGGVSIGFGSSFLVDRARRTRCSITDLQISDANFASSAMTLLVGSLISG